MHNLLVCINNFGNPILDCLNFHICECKPPEKSVESAAQRELKKSLNLKMQAFCYKIVASRPFVELKKHCKLSKKCL